MRYTLTTFAILLFGLIATPGFTAQLEIRDNKLSVEARQIPLQTLLKQLATDYGVAVRMDPAINPPVTMSFKNRQLEDGLKSLLKSHNHVLFWRANPDTRTSAPQYLLDEIHIFRPGEKGQMVSIHEPRRPPPAPRPIARLPQTEVSIKGNKVFVPVLLEYQGREVRTRLLFDTGAGSIVLHQNVADQLGIDDYQESQGQGVGGLRINTKTARLDSVTVGPHKKKDLRTDVIVYQGKIDEDYNGLLGMNFLRDLKYTIDFNNRAIIWTP